MYVRVAGGLAPHPEVVELSILHLNLLLKRTTNILQDKSEGGHAQGCPYGPDAAGILDEYTCFFLLNKNSLRELQK